MICRYKYDNILSCRSACVCVVETPASEITHLPTFLCGLMSLVCTREGRGGTSDPSPRFIFLYLHFRHKHTVCLGISETLSLVKYQLSTTVAAPGTLLEAELCILKLNPCCCQTSLMRRLFTEILEFYCLLRDFIHFLPLCSLLFSICTLYLRGKLGQF